MIRHFYTHIVETETISLELDALDLKSHEKEHLERLVEAQIHHVVVDTVLTELPEEDKKTFLEQMHTKNYDKVWKLLNAKIDKAEEKIKKAAQDITKELLKDIKDLKK
jgi:hypothetical protein